MVTCSAPMGLLQSTNIGKGGGANNFSLNDARSANASVIIPSKLIYPNAINNIFFSYSALLYSIAKRTGGVGFCIVSLEDNNQIEITFGTVTYLPPNLGFGPNSITKNSKLTYSLDAQEQVSFFSLGQPFEELNHSFLRSLNNKSLNVMLCQLNIAV